MLRVRVASPSGSSGRDQASLGLGRVTGSLAPGLAADFVVLRGRPWTDPADASADNVVAVVSRGVLVAGTLPTEPG